jgi:regulator of protease activity HflC (stomatin/prohibitin superfamily)
LNYHLNENKLSEIYSTIGTDVENKIIAPRIQEVVKAVVAKYSAEQLLSMREAVKNEIAAALRRSISEYNVVVEDIQITNFHFSQSFNAAIEAKQTAEQQAMKARNDLERVKVEAEQKVAMAEAEAEQIRIQAEAIQKQGGKEYVQLKAIEKWDGKLPAYMGGNAPMPFIDVTK